MAVYRDWCLNLLVGISFFLQVGVETEGSGPVLDSDVGSGSGDFVGNEDLLRVSIRSAGDWCSKPGREHCGVRRPMKVGGPLGDCFLVLVGIITHLPFIFTCLAFPSHFSQV